MERFIPKLMDWSSNDLPSSRISADFPFQSNFGFHDRNFLDKIRFNEKWKLFSRALILSLLMVRWPDVIVWRWTLKSVAVSLPCLDSSQCRAAVIPYGIVWFLVLKSAKFRIVIELTPPRHERSNQAPWEAFVMNNSTKAQKFCPSASAARKDSWELRQAPD